MTLIPNSTFLNVTPTQLPEGSDPRELMIEKLAEQNEILLATIDKAQSLFQETQAKQKEAIENVSKTNDDLREALLKAEARNNALQLAHQAEIQALHEKYQLQIEEEKKKNHELQKTHHVDKHNLCVYEQGLLVVEKKVTPPYPDWMMMRTTMYAIYYNELPNIRKKLTVSTD